MPDFAEIYARYIESATRARQDNKLEQERKRLFFGFLQEGFGVQFEAFEIERRVRLAAKGKGFVDAIFGDLIFEFKQDLDKQKHKTLDQLREYLNSDDMRDQDYLGVLSDGLRLINSATFCYNQRRACKARYLLEQSPRQLSLFASDEAFASDETTVISQPSRKANVGYGTFKDSLRAPIHNWFRYPAGYSHKLVEEILRDSQLQAGAWVYDPFSGTGTTLICAKQHGLHGYGVEAHAFVHWVASVKLFWEYDYARLRSQIDEQLQCIQEQLSQPLATEGVFPELVYKCYHPQTLQVLYTIREAIFNLETSEAIRSLLKLALTHVLRDSAAAGTGWPYIAPNKNTGDKPPKDAWRLFMVTIYQMVDNLYQVGRHPRQSIVKNVLGDSRQQQALDDGQINLALTSPPYLNNYDYADRTRLETYFWGLARSWSDITTLYRDKLITAATTQVVRKHHDIQTVLSPHIRAMSPSLHTAIQTAVQELAARRLGKGGKKDYDLMVALYFNDLLMVLKETHRVLAPKAELYLVLGDSAPYGVHIPTEQWIGELGLALGFRRMEYHEFRRRGGKWKDNPQRHTVALREGLLILGK